jgi:hypothetical protein
MSYEYHFPETLEQCRLEERSWFWKLCWWLAQRGWITGPEGGLYRHYRWRWPHARG